MFKYIYILIIILIIVFLVSCGNEPPSLSYPFYNIIIYQTNSFPNINNDMVFLSVYFKLSDDDGLEDISEVYIRHIDSQYKWVVPYNSLNSQIYQNSVYYGYSFIEYNNNSSVLTGDYEIQAIDGSGNLSAISVFSVNIDGVSTNTEFSIGTIKYYTAYNKSFGELRVTGDPYYSVEFMIVERPELFEGGRKKYEPANFYELSEYGITERETISVRVNKDPLETIVYFLSRLKIR